MSFRANDLQRAKVTIFQDREAKKILPYVKVTRYDDAMGYDHEHEYYVPLQLKFGLGVAMEQILEVEIEQRKDGAHPPTEQLHHFNEV